MMKLAVGLLIVASFTVAVGWRWQSRAGNASRTETVAAPIIEQIPATQPGALGVDQLMRSAEAHRRAVSVVGVVSAASADKQAVTLIDSKEFAECNDTECAQLALPVRWAGPVPAVRTTVRVDGQVQESDGKLVFVASALQEVIK